MSTNWHYRCLSHEPNISSENFFFYPEPLVKDLHRREGIVAIPDWVMETLDTSYEAKHWWWLRQHATCTIGIYNEYNESLAEWEAKQAQIKAERQAKCSHVWAANNDNTKRTCAKPGCGATSNVF